VKKDYYFTEAMNVTVDYLQALAGGVASLARLDVGDAPRTDPAPALQ
jgi:hypothetical protein